MKIPGGTASAVILGVLLSLGGSACGGPSSDSPSAHGVVMNLDPAARQITLDHGDIPGLMNGMTMTFEVAPGVALDGIDAGDEVDFQVEEVGGVYTVTVIRPSGS